MCSQPTLPADFNLKQPRGLCTPRAFVRAVLESDDYGQSFGVESWSAGYAEPGYQDPERGILFGNWNETGEYGKRTKANMKPKRFAEIAERAGYAVEWSDEWSTCEDCGKAVRTSADSYSWSPAYFIFNECQIVCRDCADPADVLEELSGDENRCLTADMHSRIDLEEQGYEKYNADPYESGWHPGQNDSPQKIAARLRERGITDFVFVQDEQSQFYIRFSVYVRRTEEQDEE